jgi:hypothetical protein
VTPRSVGHPATGSDLIVDATDAEALPVRLSAPDLAVASGVHGQAFRYAGPAGTYWTHCADVMEPPMRAHNSASGLVR